MAEYLKPDLCVIGAGAAGLAAARAARALGASVVLIERGRIGGDLNLGSIPSKALIASARRAHYLRTASQFGMSNDEPKPNFRAVQGQVQQIIDAMTIAESAEQLVARGIQVLVAEARFIDRKTVQAGETLIRARRFIIATGSKPSIPAIPGLAEVPYFTSDTIFANAKKLTHLLVIGGGPLGIELAQAFRRLGSMVTVIEPGAVLADCDPELVEIALRVLRDEGIDIRTQTVVSEIIARSQGIGVRVTAPDGSSDNLDVSHILVATGRRANLGALDLIKARIGGTKADPTRLALNAHFRTGNRRVYAIGDASGGTQQVLEARHQAEVAVHQALLSFAGGKAPLPLRAAYTDPELAEAGMTEVQARRKFKTRYQVIRVPFAENDRARTMRQTYGVAKLICRGDGRIVGAGIVGPEAGELIGLFALAIANGLSARHLQRFAAPYPTLSDVAQRLGAEYYRDAPPAWWVKPMLELTRRFG
ncbi:NAD(P)/FAD-dependent oxidoreductase [Devosia sp.]|uniref:dihydrolipoyl dehydrogenase family protein n=1 Tax=Devosia sp. TaxID=1871048 RepID=UPI003266EBC9